MDLQTLYHQTRKTLEAAKVQTSALDARILIQACTGCAQEDFITEPDRTVTREQQERTGVCTARRAAGEPVSRILGMREFYGRKFTVSPDTLDPRPDTETLIEAVLKNSGAGEGGRILDLGTGTGCILITLLKELPSAQGIGVDISETALHVARENAIRHGVEDRMFFVCGDWTESLAETESFDLIVSNPPYIPNSAIESLQTEVRNHDPILALEGGEDGLNAYRAIITKIKRLLKPGKKAFLEIGIGQLSDVMRLVKDSGLTAGESHPDIAGIPRVVEISRGDKCENF